MTVWNKRAFLIMFCSPVHCVLCYHILLHFIHSFLMLPKFLYNSYQFDLQYFCTRRNICSKYVYKPLLFSKKEGMKEINTFHSSGTNYNLNSWMIRQYKVKQIDFEVSFWITRDINPQLISAPFLLMSRIYSLFISF